MSERLSAEARQAAAAVGIVAETGLPIGSEDVPVIDMDALDVWLEQHPITEYQQTDVVLAHLLAAVISEMFKARMVMTVDPHPARPYG